MLLKITLAMEQREGDERNAQVGCGAQRIAR